MLTAATWRGALRRVVVAEKVTRRAASLMDADGAVLGRTRAPAKARGATVLLPDDDATATTAPTLIATLEEAIGFFFVNGSKREGSVGTRLHFRYDALHADAAYTRWVRLLVGAGCAVCVRALLTAECSAMCGREWQLATRGQHFVR